jgi:hypothetical protein
MANPGAFAKLKRLRQRFGINAPRLAIKTHVPWYWRMFFIIVVMSISMACAAWIYDFARQAPEMTARDETNRDVQSLEDQVMELNGEVTRLRSLVDTSESSVQMERAAQWQLANQLKVLEAENAALREDLAFFEGLSEVPDETGIKIDRLKIEPTGILGEYRYRLLIINNGGRQNRELHGGLQLLLKVQQDGKDVMMTIPSPSEKDVSRFSFAVKHFRRMEGVFSVSRDASILGVEVRLLMDGKVRATQSLIL